MPDPCRDEEIETRTLSVCLFDVADIAILNRCAHCPGAARAAIQHRRCPREPLQPNIFRPEDRGSKNRGALKSLASCSRQHERGKQETAPALPNEFARLSLVDSVGTTGNLGRSESDPDIPGSRAVVSETTRIPQGIKRKAKLEDREDGDEYRKNEFDHLSVPEYLKLKPLKRFRDLECGNLFMPGCRRIPSDEMTVLLMKCSAASPMDTQEDRPSWEASYSRPFVPGCCMSTALESSGAFACNDEIETEGCEVLACCDEMESEEP